jgi:quercetin dioxygenase-like cupin family protein
MSTGVVQPRVRKNSRELAEEVRLPGRSARVLFSGEVLGAETVTLIDVEILPGCCTTPAHLHESFEEVIYIREGCGRVWVEGEVVPLVAGEAILIPIGCRHMVKNAGDSPLRMLTCFGDKDYRRGFVEFPEIDDTSF